MTHGVMLALGLLIAGLALPSAAVPDRLEDGAASPLFGVSIPHAYRSWDLIGVAHETDPLNELRAVLGNPVAKAAFAANSLPFPDGTVLVKLAWKRARSDESPPAFVPGKATTVQVMVKDSRRYTATGGWGFGRFVDGVPADEAQHRTCFDCHAANVRNHDNVFTRFAP